MLSSVCPGRGSISDRPSERAKDEEASIMDISESSRAQIAFWD